MAELDAILSGVETPSEAAPIERARGEDGRFVSTAPPAEPTPEAVVPPEPEPQAEAPPPPPPTPPVVDEEERVPKAALQDERRKRQQYEREVAELREWRRQQEEKASQAVTPPANVWENPEAYISAATQKAREDAIRETQAMLGHQLANASEKAARKLYPDYDQVRAEFSERLAADPVLQSELNRTDPADIGEFVYTTMNRLKALQEVQAVGSIEQLRAKIREEERAKLLAETPRPPTNVPQSLNRTPSPASNTEDWKGPTPLEGILKRK